MIVWINGTHGAGKTTTSALVQPLIPQSRVFDAEKVGETLMDITPGLPSTDNFQHWPPWRVEKYWLEISAGLAAHAIPVRHYAQAASGWLTERAELVDTATLTPDEVARHIADAVNA